MSRTRAVSKTRLLGPPPREPHCSPEFWLVEPFDEEMELWTLGDEYGFVWVLMAASPEAPRCRKLPRADGTRQIREQLDADPVNVMFAGTIAGDAIDVELANLFIGFKRHVPVDVSEPTVALARVCERLKELQFYDGETRVQRFEEDGERGAVSLSTFWTTVGLSLTSTARAE